MPSSAFAMTPTFAKGRSSRTSGAATFDDLDNAWLVGTFLDGRLISSFRLHIATSAYPQMPANQVFKDYLEPFVAAGKTIVDPTRFVVDSAMATRIADLHYLTVRIGHMAAEFFDADFVLATVRSEHQAFYKRVFGHGVVCAARPYPGLIKPISLMMLDFQAERARIMRRYPFFESSFAERSSLFGQPDEVSRRLTAAIPAPALAG